MKNLIQVETADMITRATMDFFKTTCNLLLWISVPGGVFVIAVALLKIWSE